MCYFSIICDVITVWVSEAWRWLMYHWALWCFSCYFASRLKDLHWDWLKLIKPVFSDVYNSCFERLIQSHTNFIHSEPKIRPSSIPCLGAPGAGVNSFHVPVWHGSVQFIAELSVLTWTQPSVGGWSGWTLRMNDTTCQPHLIFLSSALIRKKFRTHA